MRVNLKRALKVKVLKSCTGYVFEVPTSYDHLGHAFVAHVAFTRKQVMKNKVKALFKPIFLNTLASTEKFY